MISSPTGPVKSPPSENVAVAQRFKQNVNKISMNVNRNLAIFMWIWRKFRWILVNFLWNSSRILWILGANFQFCVFGKQIFNFVNFGGKFSIFVDFGVLFEVNLRLFLTPSKNAFQKRFPKTFHKNVPRKRSTKRFREKVPRKRFAKTFYENVLQKRVSKTPLKTPLKT